ncbi:MAG: protein translocase subunit SecF [Terriglobales bacterium]
MQRYGAERENEVIIGLEQKGRTEQALDTGKAAILDTLRATFAADQGQKLDLNNIGREALASRLASLGIGDQAAASLADAILARRLERSGLLKGVADLRGLPGMTTQIEQALATDFYFTPYAIRNAEMVGPKVGADLRRQALYATLYALAGMLLYIAFRYEWVYGVAAVVATFHDVIITVGFFSLFDKEITLTVVAALLTLVGFSVNDTIVVFDRIRENLKLMRREALGEIVNRSINQTLSRTILTSGLTFLTVLSLFLFGGEVLHGFAFALVVGILVGTYSSIGIAAPIVVVWQQWHESRTGRGRVITLEKDRTREKPKVGARVKV